MWSFRAQNDIITDELFRYGWINFHIIYVTYAILKHLSHVHTTSGSCILLSSCIKLFAEIVFFLLLAAEYAFKLEIMLDSVV